MKTETTTDKLTLRAQDLRIGNLVHYKVFDEVSGDESNEENIIDSQDIEQIWQLNRSGGSGAYSAITITESHLKTFGFNKSDEGFVRIKTKRRHYFLEVNIKSKRCIIFCKNDYSELLFTKYVHQLQNLYFALTGNELTLTK